ncbi:MAG: hypothetical protein ACRDUA_11125, partial [Micromonosporaceae bacterium]
MYEPPARDATPQRSSAAERDGSPASVWPPMQLWTDPPARSEQPAEDPNAGRGQLSEQFWRRSEVRNGGQWDDEAYDGRTHEANVVPLPSAQVSPAPAVQEPPSVEGTGRAAALRERPRPLGPPPATAASLGMEDAPTGEFPRWGTGLVPPLEDVAEVSGEAVADVLSEPTLHRLNGPARDPSGGARTANDRTLPSMPSMIPLPPGPTSDEQGTWTDPPPRGIAAVPESDASVRAERATGPGRDGAGTPPVPAARSNGGTQTGLPARASGQPVPDPHGRGHGTARNPGTTIPAARDGGTRPVDRFPRRTEPSIPHPTDPAGRDAASTPSDRPRRTEPVGPHLTDPPAVLGEPRRRAGGHASGQVWPAGRTAHSGQRAPLEPVRDSPPEQPDGGTSGVPHQPDEQTPDAAPVGRFSDPLTGPLPTVQPILAVPEGLIAGPVPGWLELMRMDAQEPPAPESVATAPEAAGTGPEATTPGVAQEHTGADGPTAPSIGSTANYGHVPNGRSAPSAGVAGTPPSATLAPGAGVAPTTGTPPSVASVPGVGVAPSTGTPPNVASVPGAGAAPSTGTLPNDGPVPSGAPATDGWTGPPFVGGVPRPPDREPAEHPGTPEGRQMRPVPQVDPDPAMESDGPPMQPVVAAPDTTPTMPTPVPAPWATGPAPVPPPAAPDVPQEDSSRAEPAAPRQTPPTTGGADNGADAGAATVLTAVRELPGVRDAELVGEPGRQQVLRLDLVATVDPHTVGRQAAALLKD